MNLNEAYQVFKNRHPNRKVGISKFCARCPKECVTVGARGTHFVCVCAIHQNVKLMLLSFPSEKKRTYHDLLEQFVCSVSSSLCMLHTCKRCPGSTHLESFLHCEINEDVEEVIYKQWVTSNQQAKLIEHIALIEEYIVDLTEKVAKLAPHHFICKHQSTYLHELKENIPPNEYIILMDFTENYSFMVQDTAQGYH